MKGHVNESADLGPLTQATGTVKLNFRYILSVNSIGIVRLIKFMNDHYFMKIEFHECLPEFIALLNMIPRLLGPKEDPKIVKSLYGEFACPSCEKEQITLIETVDLVVSRGDVIVPAMNCDSCGALAKFVDDPSEFFSFLIPESA